MAPSTASDQPPPQATSVTPTSTTPTLHIIGLGLANEDDISVRGLRLVKDAAHVYLENYTSILLADALGHVDPSATVARLQALYGRPVTVADREYVEERADAILSGCPDAGGVAFLVVGDPFGATTHSDLWLRARQRNITVNVVHNASIMNAVAVTGLQLYRFGEAISLCLWTDVDRPMTYYHKLERNRQNNLHTLCLLDIKVKEPSLESLARGKKQYMPPTYMSIAQAVDQLLEIERTLKLNVLSEDDTAVGVARLGAPSQSIVCASLMKLKSFEFGPPLHSLIIPAPELHFHEREVLDCFRP